MVYVKFLTTDLQGKEVEAMGSDSVFIIDGRNTKLNMIFDGIARLNRLKNVHTDYIGFKIIKANIISESGTTIGGWKQSPVKL